MSSGVLNQISFGLESTWGTPVTPTKSIPVHFTGGIKTTNELKMVEGVKAILAKEHDSVIGARKHDGDFQMDLFTDYPGYMMLSALGAVSSAVKSGETIVYQHTLTEAATKPSLTIEQVIGEDVYRFAGSIFSDLKFTAKTGDIATLETKLMAQSRTIATKITPAYTTSPVFNFSQFAVKIGGTTLTEIISLELEYKNNIEFQHALNSSNDAAFNFVKASECTGKIELYLDSTSLTQLTNYLNKTEVSLEIIGTGGAIGSSSNYGIDITLPRVVYKTADEKLQDSYNLVTIEFVAEYDTVTAELLKIVLTNLLTAYS